MHLVCFAFSLAFANTGKSMAARIATIAITTSNYINVKPCLLSILFLCILSLLPFYFDWIFISTVLPPSAMDLLAASMKAMTSRESLRVTGDMPVLKKCLIFFSSSA
jgi:hypothetical protein